MKINREVFLKALEAVSPGLSAREVIEQSSCFVFKGGNIYTFNDEVLCTIKSPIENITCAVPAKQMLDLLGKIKEDEVEVELKDDKDGQQFMIKGNQKRAGVRIETNVLLPVENVDVPDSWNKLHDDFCEAIGTVKSCASSDEQQFLLTCVHIHPEFVEACDRLQIARYPVKTGVEKSTLVRAESIGKILSGGVIEMAETKNWIHFRNAVGLIISCRRFMDDYRSLDAFLSSKETTKVTLPGGLDEIVSRAEVFSGENSIGNYVIVELRGDVIDFKGEGASGWYQERKKISYEGTPIKFCVAPKLLVAVSKKSNDCHIGTGRLLIDTGKFVYVTCTSDPDEVKGSKSEGKKS